MQIFEVDGRIYYYDGKKFLDEYFILLEGAELQRVAEAYYSNVDYEKLGQELLIAHIKDLKFHGLYFRAKKVMDYAMEKYDDDQFLYTILPIYTSCCREMGLPRVAIERAESCYPRIEFSVALCTSLAAAYCDVKDYKNAIRFAKMAYAKQGGGQGYKTELSLVFLRIKKETGEFFYNDDAP